MTGEEVRVRFVDIAQRGCGHDHDGYLASTKKQFWGIAANRSDMTHEVLFGEPAEKVLGAQTRVSHAGYSVGALGKPQGESADVLLLATEYVADDAKSELRDSLLLHEACHLVVDANLPRLAIDDLDTMRATAILPFLHPEDTYHDLDFLQQLSAATRRLEATESAEQLFRLAMSLDTFHDSDTSLSEVEDDDW